MNVALLGATKGIGRSLARQMAQRGDRLFLLGRDLDDLQRSAADLEVRSNNRPVGVALCDLEEPDTFEAAIDAAATTLGKLDAVVVTAALFATQAKLEQDSTLVRQLLSVNFVNTVLFCERARRVLLAAGGGVLCVFSSVAGERGRKSVVIYGAGKAGLSAYLEGLDHKYQAAGLRTICVKPGFVKTGMTAGLPTPPFAGKPDAVARRVLKAIDRRRPMVYAPGIWRWIMGVIRQLPRAVMRRFDL